MNKGIKLANGDLVGFISSTPKVQEVKTAEGGS